MKGVWVPEQTLTLPYETLRTLHLGGSEVRVKVNAVTGSKQVCKRVSTFGREDTLAVNEAVLLREIDHPNVAKIFDVAEVAGMDSALACYELIMPFYERGSIFDAMVKRNERFSIGEARDIAVKALRGIGHLHDVGILHRDVKPGNVFLSDDGSIAKVGDLGEAARMDVQGIADPLLSPQYWSAPETFTGDPYTVQADIFALGMSLVEMLSGPFPYNQYTRESLARRLSDGRPAVLPRHLVAAPHVPRSLSRIVSKATNPNPASRFQSAHAMIDQLLRARFVDWSWPSSDDASIEWFGRLADRDFRVVGRMLRRGAWRIRVEWRSPSGWRKVAHVSQVDHADRDSAARDAFSQLDRQLFRA